MNHKRTEGRESSVNVIVKGIFHDLGEDYGARTGLLVILADEKVLKRSESTGLPSWEVGKVNKKE